MASVQLKNLAGRHVAPTSKTFQAAAANADWAHAAGFYMVLTEQPGKESWPITGASFILIYQDQPNASRAKTMLSFFNWCFRHGTATAEKLQYVPIPSKVMELVETTWKTEIKSAGKPVWP